MPPVADVQVLELRLGDEPERWAELGFTVQGTICRLGRVELRLLGGEGGIAGWTLSGALSEHFDGLPSELALPRAVHDAPPHANGALRLDHIVAVSPDLDRTVRALSDAGLDLRRIREEPTPAGAPRQAFFRLGEVILEVVAEPDEVSAARGRSDRPAIFWGLAVAVADIERPAQHFGEHLGTPRAAVQPGRMIATARRSAGLGEPLAFITVPSDA